MKELPDVNRLQAFVTVVEEGSLSAAVSKLHITQPALSSRLKLLEESFNCILLERTGKGVRPTPMGRFVYRHAVEVLRRMRELQRTLERHLDLREGWVHLAGGSTAVAGVFPSAIQSFRANHPDIQFTLQELEALESIESVRDGGCDLAVVTLNSHAGSASDDPLTSLEVHATFSDELVVIAAPENPLAVNARALAGIGKKVLPMHLNGQKMILPSEGLVLRDIVDGEFHGRYIKPHVVMSIRTSQSVLGIVERNIGIGVVSRLALSTNARVEIIPVDGLCMRRTMAVVGPRDRSLMPAAQGFLEFLVARARLLSEGKLEE